MKKIQILLPHIKKYYILITVYCLVLLLFWITNNFIPYLSGIFIDTLIIDTLSTHTSAIFILLLVLNLLLVLIKYLRSIISTKLGHKLTYSISNSIFQHLYHTEINTVSKTDTAYLIDQISKDSTTLVDFFTTNIVNFGLQSATFILSLIIIFNADLLLGVIISLLIPLYIVTLRINKKQIYETRIRFKQESNTYFSHYSEQIQKLTHIVRNALHEEMENRLTSSHKIHLNSALQTIRAEYLFTNINQIVVIVAYMSIIGIGGYKVFIGELTVGYFSIINTYFSLCINSISYFLGIVGLYQEAYISLERITQIMKSPISATNLQKLSQIHTISIKNLQIQYEKNKIIQYPNLLLYSGKIYGIKGCNGCGKTTLLDAIIGIHTNKCCGEISYNNINTSKLDLFYLRREKISYLEQTPTIFNMYANEYLTFGIEKTPQIVETQNKFLKQFNIEYLYGKLLSDSGSNLSGGEKQKLGLVKVLSKHSDLLLLDEPTSALDSSSITELIKILSVKKKDAIILIISHDPILLNHCDELIDLSPNK